jgi:hypothetical protein
MLATRLVVAAAALVVAVAAWDFLGTRDAPPAEEGEPVREELSDGPVELSGERVPPPGALTGTLYVVTLSGCRLLALDLVGATFRPPGPPIGCELSVSPRGDRAVVPLEWPAPVEGRAIWMVSLAEELRLERRLGLARGAAAWSPDGGEVAWCTPEGRTVLASVSSGEVRRTVAGCRPKVAPDGAVLTRPDTPLAATLLRDGAVLLGRDDLQRGFTRRTGGVVDVLGYEQRADGLLAVAAVRFAGSVPEVVLQLWQDGRHVRSIELPPLGTPGRAGRFGEVVRFSPDGAQVGVAFPGPGVRLVVVDVDSGELLLGPTSQHGFDWSPAGDRLALSTAQEIRVFGAGTDEPLYALPLGATAIAWR